MPPSYLYYLRKPVSLEVIEGFDWAGEKTEKTILVVDLVGGFLTKPVVKGISFDQESRSDLSG